MVVGVPTNAALATLTVSKGLYEKDNLLRWVVEIAPPFQLTTIMANEPATTTTSVLQLEAQSTILTCRNAILRGLCGPVFHGALDRAPFYMLGGVSSSSGIDAATKLGQLVQFMSVADSIRSNHPGIDHVTNLLLTLEQHFLSKAFLIGSCRPCLADYDLAWALQEKKILDDTTTTTYPGIHRWFITVMSSFQNSTRGDSSLQVSIPTNNKTMGPLVFYYGNEDIDTVLKPPAIPQPKTTPPSTADNDKKQGDGKQIPVKKGEPKQQEPKAKKEQATGNNNNNNTANPPSEFNISALDIRVGKITEIWHHEESDKLFCETVDLGTETRKIASGLRAFYQKEDLQDRLVLVLCNLKSRNLAGFPSHGMVLCASNADHTLVQLMTPAPGSKPGDRILFENYPATAPPEPENKIAKKKIWEQLAPDLQTDDQGRLVWKNNLGKTQAGFVMAIHGMPNAKVS